MNNLNAYKEQIERVGKIIESVKLYSKLVEVGEDHVRTMNGLGLDAEDSLHSLEINKKVLRGWEERLLLANSDLIRITVNYDTENRERLVPTLNNSIK